MKEGRDNIEADGAFSTTRKRNEYVVLRREIFAWCRVKQGQDEQ